MGFETSGTVTHAPRRGAPTSGIAKVLVETDDLILRGGVKLSVPRSAIRDAVAKGTQVTVRYDGGVITLELGDAAAKFAKKVVEPPKSRLEKMGIGPEMRVVVRHSSDRALAAEITEVGATVAARAKRGEERCVIEFVESDAQLARIADAAALLAQDGALWVIHPKGADGVKDTAVFAAGKVAGLTAVKVARFSGTHTAEKLVIPVAARRT